MPVFSVSGITSGIDFNQLIEQLMQIERQPITRLENKKNEYNQKVSAYSELSTKLSNLMSALESLKTTSSFYVRSASSDDTTVVEATASSGASPGNYTINITQLAQSHKIASDAVANLTDPISSTSGNFSFYVGSGATVTVQVTASTTLSDLKDAINQATDDVEATIVNVGGSTPYRLILTATNSGASNSIVITENVTNLGFPTGPVTGGLTLESAQDAQFTVDGLPVTKTTNVVSDVIEGVTLTLKDVGTADVTVTNDVETMKNQIVEFVNAYNEVVNYVNSQSTYDTETHQGGPFVGESTPRNILNRLRSLITGAVTGQPDDMKVLAQAGITTNRDGTLSIDYTDLDDKLTSDLSDLAAFFTDSANGFAVNMYDYLDNVTDSIDGSIAIRQKGLNDLIDDTQDQIRKLEARLEETEFRLRMQFTNLEVLLNGLRAQGSYLTSLTGIGGQ